MKLIVGLGNPGSQYAKTRHNIGFMVVDELVKELGIPLNKEKYKGVYGSGIIDGEKVFLLKPMTYMNLTGECVRPFLKYFKIQPKDMIVIYDDLDLPVGRLRLRQKGGAGGHNGMKSLIYHLQTMDFDRIRFGISRPRHPEQTVVNHVLGDFDKDELANVEVGIERSVAACKEAISTPFLQLMNEFNRN